MIPLDSHNITNKKSLNPNYRNMRLIYGLAIVITIMLGLASRKFDNYLPLFVAQNSGDMLWAMMVYFGIRFLLVRGSIHIALILCLLFCFGIEFSQLYQAEWINQLRNHSLGALILGKGFLAVDLVRYSVGIIIAALLDKVGLNWFRFYRKIKQDS